MKKVLGIIAEYNPLHNGHIYHIKKSKEKAKADYVVIILGGNFTQRGEVSIIDKWEKTKMALNSGVDLVIELPCIYSISSAENFAGGAIKILEELGFVDYLSFGTENDSLEQLNEIANILYKEDEDYKEILEEELKKGISYPKARQNAVIRYLDKKESQVTDKYKGLLSSPNNILAIEYLKALKKQNSKITPIAIKREKVGYNSNQKIDGFASASGIRSIILKMQEQEILDFNAKANNSETNIKKEIEEIRDVMPSESFEILQENINSGTYVKSIKDFEKEIIYKLRTMKVEEIKELPEITEGLENLIKTSVGQTNNIQELIDSIKSKRYTQTRIQRILLYALLGITKKDLEESKNVLPYIRILGFDKKGKELLPKIKDRSKVITSVKKFEEEIIQNINNEEAENRKANNNAKKIEEIKKQEVLTRMLEIDKLATDIYTIGYKNNSQSSLDYTKAVMQKRL